MTMAEAEENLPKRRKLDPLEALEKTSREPVEPSVDGKKNASTLDELVTEKDKDDLSRISVTESVLGAPPLSKRQLKKVRKQEKWEAEKNFRKDKRRDKRHEKQARKAQEKAEMQEKIASGEIEAPPEETPEEAKLRHTRPVQMPITLLIDCDFDELMTEKELISMGAQLTRCYSDNRHSKQRAHIAISSWKGALRTRFETILTNHHKSWKGVRFMEEDFVEVGKSMEIVMRSQDGGKLAGALAPLEAGNAPKDGDADSKEDATQAPKIGFSRLEGKSALQDGAETQAAEEVPEAVAAGSSVKRKAEDDAFDEDAPKRIKIPSPSSKPTQSIPATDVTETPAPEPSLIYLTSDSPHTLDRLSPYTSYVIGGIVDKNRHKGLCYKRACERGIPTAKLPIGEYMTMQSRTVLTTNHVVEIMLKWLDKGDWGEAFLSVIPKRKEAKLKNKKSGEEGDEDVESEDGNVEEEDDGSEKTERHVVVA